MEILSFLIAATFTATCIISTNGLVKTLTGVAAVQQLIILYLLTK